MRKSFLMWIFWTAALQIHLAPGLMAGNTGSSSSTSAAFDLREEKELLQMAIYSRDWEAAKLLFSRSPALKNCDIAQNGLNPIHATIESKTSDSEQVKILQELKLTCASDIPFYQSTARKEKMPMHAYRIEKSSNLIPLPIDRKAIQPFLEQYHSLLTTGGFTQPGIFLQNQAMLWIEETPLLLAILTKKPLVVEYLLTHFDRKKMVDKLHSIWILPKEAYQNGVRPGLSQGAEPFIWAAASQHMWSTVGLLLSLFPDQSSWRNLKNWEDQNFFHAIAQTGRDFSDRAVQEEIGTKILSGIKNSFNTNEEERTPFLEDKDVLTELRCMSELSDRNHCRPSDCLENITVEALHAAVQGGDFGEIKGILNKNPNLLHIPNKRGFYVTHTAAYYNQKSILESLLKKWPELDLWKGATQPWCSADISSHYLGYSPLWIAIFRGHELVANDILDRILFDPYLSPEDRLKKLTQDGSHPAGGTASLIHWATKRQMQGTLERLRKVLPQTPIGPSREQRNSQSLPFGQRIASLVHQSVARRESLQEAFFQNHIHSFPWRDRTNEYKPLLVRFKKAILTGSISALGQVLNEVRKENLSTFFDLHKAGGFNPIHLAAYYGKTEVLRWFRERLPKPDFLEKTTGIIEEPVLPQQGLYETPLSIALINQQEAAANLLLTYYEEDLKNGLSGEELGFKHLCWAAQGHMWEWIGRLMLLLPSEEIYRTNDEGNNFLHFIAASHFHLSDLPKTLLYKIDPLAFQVKDHNGRIPSDLEDDPFARKQVGLGALGLEPPLQPQKSIEFRPFSSQRKLNHREEHPDISGYDDLLAELDAMHNIDEAFTVGPFDSILDHTAISDNPRVEAQESPRSTSPSCGAESARDDIYSKLDSPPPET